MRKLIIIAASAAMLAPAQSWKDKKPAEWTEEEAHEVMTESPWAKTVEPQLQVRSGERRTGLMMGGPLGGGISSRRVGKPDPRDSAAPTTARLTLRWESALPVQEAARKAGISDVPTVEHGRYGIAIVGMPTRIAGRLNPAKLKAELTIPGKEVIKSVEARVIVRDDGSTILFTFPSSTALTRDQFEVRFETELGGMSIRESFYPQGMIWDGKLQL